MQNQDFLWEPHGSTPWVPLWTALFSLDVSSYVKQSAGCPSIFIPYMNYAKDWVVLPVLLFVFVDPSQKKEGQRRWRYNLIYSGCMAASAKRERGRYRQLKMRVFFLHHFLSIIFHALYHLIPFSKSKTNASNPTRGSLKPNGRPCDSKIDPTMPTCEDSSKNFFPKKARSGGLYLLNGCSNALGKASWKIPAV